MSLMATRTATGGEKESGKRDCRSNGYADSTVRAHVTASQGKRRQRANCDHSQTDKKKPARL